MTNAPGLQARLIEAMARLAYERNARRYHNIFGNQIVPLPWDDALPAKKELWLIDAKETLTALLSTLAAEGWVCVPRVATERMVVAAIDRPAPCAISDGIYRSVYTAMLAASPSIGDAP